MMSLALSFLACSQPSSPDTGWSHDPVGGADTGAPATPTADVDSDYCEGDEGDCATLRVITYTDRRIVQVLASPDCETVYELLQDGVIQPDEDMTFSLPEGAWCDFRVLDSEWCYADSGEYAIYSGNDNWFKVWGTDDCY